MTKQHTAECIAHKGTSLCNCGAGGNEPGAEESFSSKAKQAYIALAQANQALADLFASQPGNAKFVRECRANATAAMQAAAKYEWAESVRV